MNATTAILERVRSVAKIDRDALIADMERDFDPKLVSSSVSTMIRRGELQELESGEIALGDEDAIARAREEREQRKRDRDRPSMPPPSPTAHVAPVAATAPVIDVAAAVAEAVRESSAQPQKPAPARVKTIADVARKHTAATPEEHVLQLGDVYIAVTAPAPIATRVLSAALAVLGTQP